LLAVKISSNCNIALLGNSEVKGTVTQLNLGCGSCAWLAVFKNCFELVGKQQYGDRAKYFRYDGTN
jgi:hypothetical protein